MTIQKITMVNIKDNFLQSIGNTPLIKLKAAAFNFIKGVLPIDCKKLSLILTIVIF